MITRELYLFDKNNKLIGKKKIKTTSGRVGVKWYKSAFSNKKVDVIRVPKNSRMSEVSRKNFEARDKK
jgi:hypothetical protein